MTLPTYQDIGTAVEGTGAVSPAWPTHVTGDVALLVIESCGGEAATLSTGAGFAAVTNSPQSALTGTNGTRITVFWCRATSAAMATPTVADPGNHVAAVIVTFRGVIGGFGVDPWDVTAGNFKDVASTSDTLPAVTTTVIDCLVVLLATRNAGTAGSVWNGTYTNGSLGSITERLNGYYGSGNGGGILVVTGTKATAGSTGTTAATLATSQTTAYLTIALRPPRIAGSITGSADADTVPAGMKVAVGAITGSAEAYTTIISIASGDITQLAQVDVTVVGLALTTADPPGEFAQPPGAVWRLGKLNGGDDYSTILQHVVEWSFTCAWEPEPVGGQFVYPAAGLPGCDGLFPGAEVAVILEGRERRNCRFTVHDPVDEIIADEDGNTITHNIRWTLLNMFHRFGSTTIRPPDGAVILRDKEWLDVPAGEPINFVIHQAHTDDALTEIQFDFKDNTDSADVAWEDDVDLTVVRGVSGIDVIRSVWDLHVFDTWFERRRWRAFNVDSQSVNYAGSGTKILLAGRDLLGAPRTIESRSRATRVWVRGDEDRFAVAALDPEDFDEVDTHTGYLDVTEDASGVKNPDKLQTIANLYLDLYKQPRRQLTYGVNLGWGKDPLVAYQLGDWILKRDGSEVDGLPEKVRVVRCFYKGNQSGEIEAGITVDDWFGQDETRARRRIDGIVGGLAGFARPNRSALPPTPPIVDTGDIVMTVVPPEHGGLETITVSIPFTWDGLDVDGVPCGDFDTFLARWDYGGHGWTVLEFAGSPAVIRGLDPGREIDIQMGSQDEAGNRSWTETLI